MRKFILKGFLLTIILASLLFLLNFLEKDKTVKSDYMAEIIDKHRHADSIKTPKVIFAGGSNLAFGINSSELEKEIGLPVANMGLHAGLGLSFILTELKFTAHKNDIVFLSVEYFLDIDGANDLKENTAGYYPPSRSFFNYSYSFAVKEYFNRKKNILKNIIENNNRNIPADDTAIYSRKYFNEYGDMTSHLNKPGPAVLIGHAILLNRKWEGIKELNKFAEYAIQNNIKCFFLFPNYPVSEYTNNSKAIKILEADLRKSLRMEIINTPSDFVYPDSLFFDTIYHLNKEGRNKRTEKLAYILKRNNNVQKAFQNAKNLN